MQQDWTIQSRAPRCSVTGVEFQDGEYFYTLLFDEVAGLRREDLSEKAWKERNDSVQPYSFWRSKFEMPPPAPPEPLAKQTAEDLLRRYMEEESSQHAAARYLLAVMLERKKLLREVQTKRTPEGELTRIYEHAKTGEVFVIPDPQLRLDQIAQVQQEVGELLSPGSTSAAAPAPAPVVQEPVAPTEEAAPAEETAPAEEVASEAPATPEEKA